MCTQIFFRCEEKNPSVLVTLAAFELESKVKTGRLSVEITFPAVVPKNSCRLLLVVVGWKESNHTLALFSKTILVIRDSFDNPGRLGQEISPRLLPLLGGLLAETSLIHPLAIRQLVKPVIAQAAGAPDECKL